MDTEQKEIGGQWATQNLEYESKEIKARNPIPSVGGPMMGEDRRAKVPKSIETYLKKRYGLDIKVDVGNRFGRPDGSRYSYDVSLEGEKIAEMESVLTTVHFLPPGYDGYLKETLKKIQEENSRLMPGSRRAELVLPLWLAKESSKAVELRRQQNLS